MNIEQAIETYDRTLLECSEHEYPEWVKEVKHCLETEDLIEAARFSPWVVEVLKQLRERKQISHSK